MPHPWIARFFHGIHAFQHDWEQSSFLKMNNFQPLEVVHRVIGPQLQVAENPMCNVWHDRMRKQPVEHGLFSVPHAWEGGGPRVVASTAAFRARARGSVPGLGGLKETKNVSSPSTCESQYCGEPPWPRGSVLGLRPPGLEFRILCLEDSVISIISPSSGGSPGPV